MYMYEPYIRLLRNIIHCRGGLDIGSSVRIAAKLHTVEQQLIDATFLYHCYH